MNVVVAWSGGGEARLVSITRENVEVRSSVPHPPGARVEGTVHLDATAAVLVLRLKVHACKREGDGTFSLRGRPLDLTRQARERLEASLVS